MSEWKKYRLGDLADLRKDQIIAGGKEQPYIGLEHIEQQTLRLNGIGNSKDVISNKFKFQSGDILYGKLRPYFRKVYQPKFEGVCSTDIYVIKNKPIVNNSFLYYLVATEEFTVLANSGSTGTRMPRASWSQLENTEWAIPDLPTQTQIASILTSFDDKIELLGQMNQTLETMAQTIFKEWFVDFNFPGFDGELVDGLPKGWRKGKLGEVCYVQNGYAFKSNDLKDFGDDGIIKIKNISDKQVDIINTQFVSKTVSEIIDLKFKVKSGDVLIAMTGAEVGKIGLVPKNDSELWLNQRVGNFKEKIEFTKWFVFLILIQNEYQSLLFSSASGSAQPNISASQIEDIEITVPNKKIIEEFGKVISPFFEKILENQYQIRTLALLRDALLPKLMNGQVKINTDCSRYDFRNS